MPYSYQSTRSTQITADAPQAVLKGLADDGGLFVLPDLEERSIDLEKVCHQSYLENAAMILEALLPGFDREQIQSAVHDAYTDSFSTDEITPLVKVGDVHVLELFHGPTSAFKDVALTLLPQLVSRALPENKKALILTATSGDTGKAALSGFQDVKNTGIAVFYPDGKVSQIQYRQMATQKGGNVHVYGIQGNFDDAQTMVKKLFADEDLKQKADEQGILLTSANSINVGRLVPQVVYYFEAYKKLVESKEIRLGDPVSFSVPTGNFGDVLAGFYAKMLGLPVKTFYVASNSNNVLTDFIKTGTYDRNRPFVKTISPSMDILVSSNLERLLYYLSNKNNALVADWMTSLNETGTYTVDEATLSALQDLFKAEFYDDEATKKTIGDVYKETGYVLDPHSAIGYALAKNDGGVVVSLATASPYKFAQDVESALGHDGLDEWEALHQLESDNKQPVPAPLASLETAEILHTQVLAPDQMKEEVSSLMENMMHD